MLGYGAVFRASRTVPRIGLRLAAASVGFLLPFGIFAAEPAITADSKDVVTSYTWGYQTGVKQQYGSYKNGRSLHAIAARSGTSGTLGSPDFLAWVDEHTGQVAALERPVGYTQLGKNPATSAVFTSDAPTGEQGRIWWVLGGRADLQPFDVVRSTGLFNPFGYELVLDDFVSDFESTTPTLAAVGSTGMVAYRWLESRAPDGQVRIQNYDLGSASPVLASEVAIGQASSVSPYGDVTIEQVWSRWDPRHRVFAVSWQWFIRPLGTSEGQRFGSNPFMFTEDFGVTWQLADGSLAILPLTYAGATPTSTPHDHLALGEDTNWFSRDLGFTPGGTPWITLTSGPLSPNSNGWQITFFRWNQSGWEGTPLSIDMQARADAVSCGPTRDYLVCAYSEFSEPGVLNVKVSRDDGATWSAPVPVSTLPAASNGSTQRFGWVSFAQPADRYLDNSAHFFLGFYRESDAEGMVYKNRICWIRVQVGPRADFNGDETVDDADVQDFTAAHGAGESGADFNDDGVIDSLDIDAFNAAFAGSGEAGADQCGDDPGGSDPPPPPVSGTGLIGTYFNNKTLSGAVALTRIEAVNFGWGTKSPGAGVDKDNFSVRWTGTLKAPASGTYKFRTATNDGVRLWIDGEQVIDSWVNRSKTATKTSAAINLTADQHYAVTMEFYDNTGAAVARLKWLKPGTSKYAAIPKSSLYSNQ